MYKVLIACHRWARLHQVFKARLLENHELLKLLVVGVAVVLLEVIRETMISRLDLTV